MLYFVKSLQAKKVWYYGFILRQYKYVVLNLTLYAINLCYLYTYLLVMRIKDFVRYH